MDNFLEWMLESSLLVLMIFGIRKIFAGRIRYAGIYALWAVVLLRFMIPVNLISTPLSVGNIVSGAISSWREERVPLTADGSSSAERYSVLEGEPSAGASRESGMASGLVTGKSGTEVAFAGQGSGVGQLMQSADGSENAGLTGKGRNVSESAGLSGGGGTVCESAGLPDGSEGVSGDVVGDFLAARGIDCQLLLDVVRPAVSGIVLIWLLLSNLCLMRKLRRDRVFCGKRGRLKIYAVPHVKSPCLYGFFRPAIYLPEMAVCGEGSKGIAGEALRQVITHEYVHFRHGDYIWSMLCMVLVSVYWYDPFLWLAVSRFKKDAELFCDETVIGLLGEEKRFGYGELLVRMAGNVGWGDFRYSMMSMSRRGREMEKRIRAISGRRRYSRWAFVPLIFVVSLALGVTCSAGFQPFAERTSAAGAGSMPWLQEGTIACLDEVEALALLRGKGWDKEFAVASCEETFALYMNVFTEAVNSGMTGQMRQVLAVGSEAYGQQCALVKNYYKRGIREEVISSSVTETEEISSPAQGGEVASLQIGIRSKEKIRVFYRDGTSKIVRQQYRYTCEERDGKWLITNMEEV